MRNRVLGDDVTRRSMRGFDPAALVAAREAMGWNSARLAREAGVGLTTLRHWERAQASPEPDNLARVAAALGTTIEAFIRPRTGPRTLADLRILAGLTQPQLGRLSQISTTSIGALERAEIKLSTDRAGKIAGVLRLTVEEVQAAYEAARVRADEVP